MKGVYNIYKLDIHIQMKVNFILIHILIKWSSQNFFLVYAQKCNNLIVNNGVTALHQI